VYEDALTIDGNKLNSITETTEISGKYFVLLGLNHDIIYLDYHLDY